MSASSAEMTAYREHHASLSEQLAGVDRQIGELNRVVRQHRADVQARSANGAGDRQKAATPKKEELLNHPEWLVYFQLSARNELSEALYQQVERGAKALLQDALDMGVEAAL